ncbi:MAG: single-stranded-DNA-specific exonuclease RecJ [Planctomycetota bacterium]|nr:single-stranded-DNA-specific exonuclease RecJ [Planctomycetota bacterium]MDG2143279.1 single-stranded-DNA-specific exonuclease RecJ [Planctomycetota bacterium]
MPASTTSSNSSTNLTTTGPLWSLRTPDSALVGRLAKRLDLASPIAALLVNRGHEEPANTRSHLEASPMGLHDPMLMPDMQKACERLQQAVEGGETILVHGDYDVDGVTGTTILMRLFDLLGAKAVWHIPNRMTDGYSFGDHSVKKAQDNGATLVISVDNGTSAFETIHKLKQLGIDTIVTDHHEPPKPSEEYGELPCAVAIVNAKLPTSTYPFPELCGGAVAFKLAWAFAKHTEGTERVSTRFKAFLEDALSYVAIATLCDVVPLRDENRIFARSGLAALGRSKNPGLAALAKVAGLDEKPKIGAQDVTFGIGPRINASGRLGSAKSAVELLLAKDEKEGKRLAAVLDEMNIERRAIEKDVLEEAREEAEKYRDKTKYPILFVAGQGWHQGVVGIIAARLTEEYGRPAIVIGLDGDEGRGSARSIAGFSVLEAMHGAAKQFMRYGGHAAAAGCEIREDQVEAARESVNAHTKAWLAERNLTEIIAPPLVLDTELPLSVLSDGIMHQVDRLEPFGEANAEPLFLASDVRLDGPPRRVGADQSHLMVNLRQGAKVYKAIAFKMGPRADELIPGTPIHIAYRPMWNTFRGRTKLEIQLLDFQVGDLRIA